MVTMASDCLDSVCVTLRLDNSVKTISPIIQKIIEAEALLYLVEEKRDELITTNKLWAIIMLTSIIIAHFLPFETTIK